MRERRFLWLLALGDVLRSRRMAGRGCPIQEVAQMSRSTLKAFAAVAAATYLAACSDAPVQPGGTAATPSLAVASSAQDDVVPGDVLVKMKDGSLSTLDAVARENGLARGA